MKFFYKLDLSDWLFRASAGAMAIATFTIAGMLIFKISFDHRLFWPMLWIAAGSAILVPVFYIPASILYNRRKIHKVDLDRTITSKAMDNANPN